MLLDSDYSGLRRELIITLVALSDDAWQRSLWLERRSYRGFRHHDFDQCVHLLFDDTRLSDTPLVYVGKLFRSADEARAIANVVERIEDIFGRHGTEMSDAEYMGLPEWPAIQRSAREALAIMGVRGDSLTSDSGNKPD